MKYRGIYEATEDVDADSEEEAQRKVIEAINRKLTEHPGYITVWENE